MVDALGNDNSFSLTVNIDKFLRKMGESVEVTKQFQQSVMLESAEEYLETIRRLAPKNTGRYADSWAIANISDDSVTIKSPLGQLGWFLEFGTMPHFIYAKRKKYLHWVDPKTGEDRFATFVWHPGFAAMPHIRPAKESVIVNLPNIIKDAKFLYANL